MAHIGYPERIIKAPPETIPLPVRRVVEDEPAPALPIQPKEPVPA